MLSYRPDEIVGMHISKVAAPSDIDIARKSFEDLLKSGNVRVEMNLSSSAGANVPVVLTATKVAEDILIAYCLDISDLKKAQDMLSENSMFLRSLIDAIPSPVFYKDVNCRYMGCNLAFEMSLGVSRDEVIGKSVHELSPKHLADEYHKRDLELLSNPGVQTYESRVRYSDDMEHSVIFSKATFKDLHGKIAGIIGVMQDVTEIRDAERAVRESRERLAVTLKSIGDGVIATDAAGCIKLMNTVAESLTGWRELEARGKHVDEVMVLVNESSGAPIENPVICALREKRMVEMANHTVLLGRHGARFVLEDSAAPILGKDGVIDGVVLVFRDSTERKKLEISLKESEERFRGITGNIPGIVYRCRNDSAYTMEYISGEVEFLTGYSAEEFIENSVRSFSSIIHPDDFAMVRQVIGDSVSRKKAYDITYRMLKRNGEINWVHEKGRGVYDDDGNLVCLDGVIIDVAREKFAEEQLKNKNEELERLYHLKSEFTSMVSHELRTPLAAIKEGISIVTDGTAGGISKDQAQFLGIAKRNVDRLHRIIDDILDFSKLEARKNTLKLNLANLAGVIREAVRAHDSLARSHGLKIEMQLADEIPNTMLDEDRILQVMDNLIGNAIKFTDKGTISVNASVLENSVVVSISDTGIGIAKEDLPRLFHKFEQFSHSKKVAGGTGLGLAICKEIVEQHGGRIWAESEHGAGSRFYFTIPIIK